MTLDELLAPYRAAGANEKTAAEIAVLGGLATFTIRTSTGTRAVVGYHALPGLAVTLDSETELGWRLTHVRSGCSLAPRVWSSAMSALEAATIYQGLDLTRPASEIACDPDLAAAAELLLGSPESWRSSSEVAAGEELDDLAVVAP